MKNLITILALALACQSSFAAIGGHTGNGGDPNEAKFKDIASNISQWIQSGNADQLNLPNGVSLKAYKSGMLTALRTYLISFTTTTVRVDGAEKTCSNAYVVPHQAVILCNSERFNNASTDEQYRLVHHEMAGLAGLEVNNGEDSDYRVSDQVSAFLQDETIRRLPIIKSAPPVIAQSYGVTEDDEMYGHLINVPGTCDEIDTDKVTALFADAYAKIARNQDVIYGYKSIAAYSTHPAVNSVREFKNGSTKQKYWSVDADFGIQYTLTNGTLLDLKIVTDDTFKKVLALYPGTRYLMHDVSKTQTDRDGNVTNQTSYCQIQSSIQADLVNHQYQTTVISTLVENFDTTPMHIDRLLPSSFKLVR